MATTTSSGRVTPSFESKGSVFRGYLKALAEQPELCEEIKRRVPAATRELMEHPPLVSSWIDAVHNDAVAEAYGAIRGFAACAQLGHHIMTRSMSPFVRPVLSGMVALLGASPHSLLARLDGVANNHMRPLTLSYQRLTERSCEVTMTFPRPLPVAGFHVWAGVLSYVFDLGKNTNGVIETPRVSEDRRSARYLAVW